MPIFVERVIMGVIGGFAKVSPTDGRRGAALDIIVQLTLNGLAVGCIYGLVALGFVLIYKATELVNFAQGCGATRSQVGQSSRMPAAMPIRRI
jgi:hypothetical protein